MKCKEKPEWEGMGVRVRVGDLRKLLERRENSC